MAFPADPAGDFASDAHRRVLAAVPLPDADPLPFKDLVEWKLAGDVVLELTPVDVGAILTELKDAGYVKETKTGWRHTKVGHELLTAPPPLERARLKKIAEEEAAALALGASEAKSTATLDLGVPK